MVTLSRGVGASLLALLLAACTSSGGAGTAPGAATPRGGATASTQSPAPKGSISAAPSAAPLARVQPPPGAQQLKAVRVRLQHLASFDHPTAVAEHGDNLYVTERSGVLRVLAAGARQSRPLLDLRREVSREGERGLLGAAFSPSGSHLYLSFVDRRGDNRLVEYAMRDGSPVRASRRDVLRVDQPGMTHVGGEVAFGPDGLLWMGIGEGGSAHTASGGHVHETGPRGLDSLLGKILRIDPRPSGQRPYTVPDDNPYVHRRGARPEVWAYGMRNPWRFSFDRVDRELWIGDVGQYQVEEITRLRLDQDAGVDLGWPYFEGTRRERSGKPPGRVVPPLLEYGHDGRCAVIGGYVYRGTRIPNLAGAYLYSDFCDGRVRALSERNGKIVAGRDLGVRVNRAVSFGEDSRGELFVLSSHGSLFRLIPA